MQSLPITSNDKEPQKRHYSVNVRIIGEFLFVPVTRQLQRN